MTRKVKPLIHLEQLEPRILLSGDSLLNIAPNPDQDTILDNPSKVVQEAELLHINEQVEEQISSEIVQSDTPNTYAYEPIFTLCVDDDNPKDESIDAELRVNNVGSAQSSDVLAVLSNNSGGDIKSKVVTTDDGSTPTYIYDGEITVEETLSIEIRGPPVSEIVALSSMHLVDSTVDYFKGQVIYLDFDGANDVTYNGPVTIEGIDVPVFTAPDHLSVQEDAVVDQILEGLRQTFDGSGVIFTVEKPEPHTLYSTIYIGGDDSAFSEYGSFLGLAEQVDVGNKDFSDKAFVFSDRILVGQSSASYASKCLVNIIAHEVGHLLGYAHDSCGPGEGVLFSVAEENPPIPEEPELALSEFQVPGRLEATGTHFELEDSEYLNITLDSSEQVKLILESAPEMVTLHIEPASGVTSTDITLGGFLPSTTYYKYEDNYHNLITFTTDNAGKHTYTQDLSESHLVFIQPRISTIFLTEGGWSDPAVGTWDPVTRTAVLTTDINETIQIDADNVTLDGSGHIITGSNTGIGIHLYSRTGVTIENLEIQEFNVGIYLWNSNNNTLTSNTVNNNKSYGIGLSHSNNNTLTGNTANNNNWYGILLASSNNNTLMGNDANNNNTIGIDLNFSNNNTLTGNSANNHNISGIYLSSSGYNTLTGNNANNNNTYGISLRLSDNNTLIGNTASNNYLGIRLTSSKSNTLRDNLMNDNLYNFGVDTSFDNNIDTTNLVDGKPIYYLVGVSDIEINSSSNAGTVYCIECDNITIKDLVLTNNGNGICFYNTNNSLIENNQLNSNRSYGIFLTSSNNNTLTGNDANNNNTYGIVLSFSDNNTLIGNTACNNGYGIRLTSSNSNTLRDNLMNDNIYNFGVDTSFDNNIDTTNLVDGKPIYYLVGVSGIEIDSSSNAGIVYCIECDNITIKDLVLTNNGNGIFFYNTNNSLIESNQLNSNSSYGIYLYSSNNNTLTGNSANNNNYGICLTSSNNNTLTGNSANNNLIGIRLTSSNNNTLTGNSANNYSYGIYLYRSNNNTLMGNDANNNNWSGIFLTTYSKNNTLTGNTTNNNYYGIRLTSSNNNTLTGNTANNNSYGIYLISSDVNKIYLNNFIDNLTQAYASGASGNVLNLDKPIGGNYWSDWTTPDIDGDGFVDSPYIFTGGQDNLPWANKDGWLSENYFNQSSLNESLLSEKANLADVVVSGDFESTLDFTSFEIITITTGPFAGKGFSKGKWETTLDGLPYSGTWQGVTFLNSEERIIFLRGSVTGEILGIVEGCLTESIPGSGIYDQYQAAWKTGRIGNTTASATIQLSGSVSYQNSTEFLATELYLLQTNIDGIAYGDYTCRLNTVITHIRITEQDNPYCDEGFSIISYVSESGSGLGWTYDKVISPGKVQLNGLLADPRFGIVSGILDESELPRILFLGVTRVDLGLPPAPDLKVITWGPGRVSPGQTVDYMVEYRNDGLMAAEDIDVVMKLPYEVEFVSATSGGTYKEPFHEVNWHLENIPPKTTGYLTVSVKIVWGLPQGTQLKSRVSIPKEREFEINPDFNMTCEVLQVSENYMKTAFNIPELGVDGNLLLEASFQEVLNEIEPTSTYNQIGEEVNVEFMFTMKGSVTLLTIGVVLKAEALTYLLTLPLSAELVGVKFESRHNALQAAYESGNLSEQNYDLLTQKHFRLFKMESSNMAVTHALFLVSPVIKAKPEWVELLAKYVYSMETGLLKKYASMLLEYDEDGWWDSLYNAIEEEGKRKVLEYYEQEKKEGGLVDDISHHEHRITTARDPNQKLGPEDRVSPSQQLNYVVEYENEGEGIAFGVYFTDTLDEDLNDSTLEIGPVVSTIDGSVIAEPGIYNIGTRTITWFVGEVGPGEGGITEFSVNVRDDAEDRTEIINYATVYFPSVPEETRTNGIVSIVSLNQPPVAAAGGPYTVAEGGSVLLDASGTTDPDLPDDVLTYEWDFDGDGEYDDATGVHPTFSAAMLDGPDSTNVGLKVTDSYGEFNTSEAPIDVINVAPSLADAAFEVEENSPNGTVVGTVSGSDPGDDTLTYSIVGGTGAAAFAIDANSGQITVADESQLDYETTPSFTVEVQVEDDDNAKDTATVTINLLNQASITGTVFVDINGNGVYEANEPGIDGITIELLDENGMPVLYTQNNPVTAITSDGGFYLFEDLDPGTYQLREVQPTGVDDGVEILGSLGGTIPANDTMRLTLERIDATDYIFAELGQSVASGDTATIGFWQNKHGQALIRQGAAELADWLTNNFGNVFGDTFIGGDSDDVASFYRDQLFRQKSQKSAGPAKVDAQFMAMALATYFTSSNLAGNVASDYGFNVTDTGIGTKVMNVGDNGTAFGVASGSDLTIMQLLLATNDLTDQPDNLSGFARIYDLNGDGEIDEAEASLRRLANEVYSAINEQGDI